MMMTAMLMYRMLRLYDECRSPMESVWAARAPGPQDSSAEPSSRRAAAASVGRGWGRVFNFTPLEETSLHWTEKRLG